MNEINAIYKRYEKAVEAEKEAKQIQRDCFRQLKDELFKFKNLLIETGDINFVMPISCDGGAKFVVGLFYDDNCSYFFPEGRVRLKVKEHGVFDKNNGVHETALILAKALEFATIEANRMFE